MVSPREAFDNLRYLRMNARRLEHLATLALPVSGKPVLEVGAGVGDLTGFFLDRGCRVTSVEPRPENVATFQARYASAEFWPAGRLRVLTGDVYHLSTHGQIEPHPVLFCYGLLYHLDQPQAALQEIAASCSDLLILESCVSYDADESIVLIDEDASDHTNAISGRGCLPSRRWVYQRLSELFEHVYMPLTQPLHEQFCLDWRQQRPPPGRHRAIFVAARHELVNSMLYRGIPDRQFSELPQLGTLADQTQAGVIVSQTIIGPMACFPNDLITDQLLQYGAHTRNDLAMLLSFVDAGDLVYDVGAHIGTFTISLAAAAGPAGSVIAIEAHPASYSKLRQNLGARGLLRDTGPIQAIHALVGEAGGRFAAHSVAGNSGATYFMPAQDTAGTPPMRGLDDLHAAFGAGRPVAILKIDVEGMELAVLRTAQTLLSRDRPILYIEISVDQLARHGTTVTDIERLLRLHDYRFFRNTGDRNSLHDGFALRPLATLADGGAFFDLLAIPAGHPRLPRTTVALATGVPATARGPSVYSFIVDGAPQFRPQTRIFLSTLMRAGVAADDIIAHVTPSAATDVVDHIKRLGVRSVALTPVIDGAYGNKIGQIAALLAIACDTLILCDTDLAFLDTPTGLTSGGRAMAKPVDYQNPPLDRLEALRQVAGIAATPRIVETTIDRLPTYSTNCNGGLYLLPRPLVARLQHPWFSFASLAAARRDILGHWSLHADQIGFALAMLSLNEDVVSLPVEYNFPMHVPAEFSRFAFTDPKILHYHSCIDPVGKLTRTGDPRVDRGIMRINEIVAASPEYHHTVR